MANPVIPIDRYGAKESGRAIQEAQDTVMVTGAAATLTLIRELLKHLKLPEKPSQTVEQATQELEIEKNPLQEAQGTVPIIVVLNREVERNFSRSQLKDNLKSINSRFQKAVKDFSGKISSFLGSAREKLFPTTERALEQDLQNLAVVNVAFRLLERFGCQTANGKQVFEGNSFRLERWDNNLTVTAKDGRGTILSLKDGELTGSLTAKDVEKFLAVARQFNRGWSRQSQAEIG